MEKGDIVNISGNGQREKEKVIVVAEDNDMHRYLLEYYLRTWGYEVESFENGEEAACFMDVNLFDLLITDLNMPRMDGLELIRYVRENISEMVPVIAISAERMPETGSRLLEAGAGCFLGKPFMPADLIACVTNLTGEGWITERQNTKEF